MSALITLPDESFDEVQSLVNATLRELVFAEHYAADNCIEEAETSFHQCTLNLFRIHDILAGKGEAKTEG